MRQHFRSSLRPLLVPSVAIALTAVAVPAHAQQYWLGQLGVPFSGCGIYACYTLTLNETSRSGPVLPEPGAFMGGNNVPSYLVTYSLGGTATPTAAPFAVGASVIVLNTGVHFNIGDPAGVGEGGCCATAAIPLGGYGPGSVIPFMFDFFALATGPLYLPASAPPGAAGFVYDIPVFESINAGPNAGANPGFPVALSPSVTATPEPASFALVGGGLLALGLARTRRGRRG